MFSPRVFLKRPKGELLAWTAIWLELNPLFQAVKSYRSGDIAGVEPLTFAIIMIIGGVWLWYGITIRSGPLIVGNILKLVSAAIVVIMYLVLR
ncbi:MAG: hypothetical protein A2722_00540 [Candidatus Doudnabacteria bacterium RIFCSPHIGHO2_01_FULL_50_11]|uniref:MtN3 and saliva related transmembrane protein n=1 Tax=Candidatus Doudnabacteria bacterium RIFCSPHIGHO2_01_FULL_50_11 TaxID=1817828 RepID=A0A1F5PH23_9BACT|nr:MAG: hypothetical protein A2722_00540 [Candidatus Doudnabacteria bacterium RIFCSPHIGHO2_01_FULL_50_11]HLC44346.1 SemiSWEET family transporter [Patescibacteria group bacterium]